MALNNNGTPSELRKPPEEISLAAKIETIRQSLYAGSIPGFGRPDVDLPSQGRKCHSCRTNIWNCDRAKPSCSECTQLGANCEYPIAPPKSGSSCTQCEDLNIACNQEMPSCLGCVRRGRNCSYSQDNTVPIGSIASTYQKIQSSSVATKPVTKSEASLLNETPRTACHNCRKLLIKCDKQWPHCLSCREKDIICRYSRKQQSKQPDPPFPIALRPESSKVDLPVARAKSSCIRCRRSKLKCSGEKPRCMACKLSGRDCQYLGSAIGLKQKEVTHLGEWSQEERELAYDMYHMGMDHTTANKQWVCGSPEEGLPRPGTASQASQNLAGIIEADTHGSERKPDAMPQHFIRDLAPIERQKCIEAGRSNPTTIVGKGEALFNINPFVPESSSPPATLEAIHAPLQKLPTPPNLSTELPIIEKSTNKKLEGHHNKQKRKKRVKRSLSQASSDSWEVLERDELTKSGDENISDSWDEC